MKKINKLITAAVSVVMAGTMMFSIVGCTPEEKPGPGPGPGGTVTTNPSWTGDAAFAPKLDANNNLTYDKATTELNINVCNSSTTSSFKSEISGTVVLPDGVTYNAGDLKPAWQALAKKLQVKKMTDVSLGESSDNQIKNAITNNKLAEYDILTGSGAIITQNTDSFLNLTDYLAYMPNYSNFLDNDIVTKYALQADENGAMYYAPYYDGNNDIEKYAMANKNWTKYLLDATDLSAATGTFVNQATTKGLTGQTYVTPWMGTKDWTIETTDPADATKTVTLNVKYSAALTNAELKAAYKAAVGADYTGTSGNIVDIMNAAITATNGAITGAQLTKILQCYIDAVYQTAAGAKFYATRSDVFNSASAAWDVDLLTAFLRCVVTSYGMLQDTTYKGYTTPEAMIFGIVAREGHTQRRTDLIALTGELYGVRGLESRYENTYIAADGTLKDARLDPDSYNAMAAMANLTKEGLIYTGTAKDSAGAMLYSKKDTPMGFMMHDYAQTQSKEGLFETDMAKYNIAPIVTPVSKWDTDDDGTHETTMRFTESWRSVKNTGFCVPKDAVKNNPDKLSAVLTLIDYYFSNDGQYLMTYGEMSTDATGNGGWWYGTPSNLAIDTVATKVENQSTMIPQQYNVKPEYKSQCFVYEGKVYTGTAYNGTQIPTMTTNNMDFYLGKEVNGYTMGAGNLEKLSQKGNYTNYARYALGTTLPIGNKHQGFEYQCTAKCALDGAAIVSDCLQNGTIKHVKLTLDKSESLWYQIVPVTLPLTPVQQTAMSDYSNVTADYFVNNKNVAHSVYTALIWYGFDTTKYVADKETLGLMKANAEELITLLNQNNLKARVEILQKAWESVVGWNMIG